MSAIHQVLLGSSAAPFAVANSLRIRAAASANLSRSPSTPTSTQKMTFSFWFKRGDVASQRSLYGAGTGSFFTLGLSSTGVLEVSDYVAGYQFRKLSTALFRDPSAWYHIVVAFDTTQATPANRVKIYVNNTQVTSFTTDLNPSLNYTFATLNASGISQVIGGTVSGSNNFDGYFSEFNFVDGQQLTPSSFGATDSVTGVWNPKRYSGTYGNNGYYLKFSDASSTTTISQDSSGLANNWTSNNISVTSGVTYDQMTDTPTLNYPVISPINSQATVTISEANMASNYGGASNTGTALVSIPFPTTGKWYYEHTCIAVGSFDYFAGVMLNRSAAGVTGNIVVPGTSSNEYAYRFNGDKMIAGVTSAYGSSYTANDVIGVAFDADNLTIQFYKNNVAQGLISSMPSGQYVAFTQQYGGGSTKINFGQRPFSYTPPTGFKALNTTNLPTPSIKKGSLYMDATLRTGTGATASVSSLGFQPDLVWIKYRDVGYSHALYDAVRGAQKQLESNNTDGETTYSTGLTSFDSTGYTIGSLANINTSGGTFVDWAWKEGATPGFDIVTYTGNGTNRTISHTLGAAPKFMVVKRLDAGNGWVTYHASQNASPATGNMYLNSQATFAAASTMWNNTAPTSSVFSVGTNSETNGNTFSFVAYLWSEIEGFSKFSSYTGNANADGPFVWCGFRPRYILFKNATSAGNNWLIFDTARNSFNLTQNKVAANAANSENDVAVCGVTENNLDILSNGFKLRTSNAQNNGSGSTIIFAAFAENPFKYARAR